MNQQEIIDRIVWNNPVLTAQEIVDDVINDLKDRGYY